MREKVWSYIREHRMLQAGDRVVVGVSGGGDSMALLHLLCELRERGGFSVAAFHLHHGIRGAEADRDERTVLDYCAAHGIEARSVRRDVRQFARERKLGEEEAGREVRRAELAAFCEKWHGTKIALAHHKNDLAETVLHHLARGTGLRGLRGIVPVNGNVIRPFLCIEREEIVHYLKTENIPWETDSTNLTDAYTRNRIRRILKMLNEEVNSRAAAHIAQTAQIAAEADDYLFAEGEKLLLSAAEEDAGAVLLLPNFFRAAGIVQSYALLEACRRLCGVGKDILSEHLAKVKELAKKPVGKRAALPHHLTAERTYRGVRLYLRRTGQQKDALPEVTAEADGTYRFGKKTFVFRRFFYRNEEIVQKKYTKWFDYDKINGNLQIRCRKQGDFLVINDTGQTKRLKDYFINEKIPQKERDRLPLICQGSEVLWAAGCRRGESAKVTEATKIVLEITYEEEI